ncbi:MAG TPA: DUF1345 domain-containing protein [Mycobacteriales bacterium]|nr:DUF1345 domain-containing protein [Mycobacteriales bacterium]
METAPASTRSVLASAAGIAAAVVTGLLGDWTYAPAVGFDLAGALFLGATWLSIGRMDAAATAAHATREDPTRRMTRLIILAAAVASLAGVGTLLLGTTDGANRAGAAVLGLGSVAIAWLVVHSLFTLHYAELYYGPGGGDPARPAGGSGGGIDFGLDTPARYADFAYLAFTIGMTYQLSDTPLTTRELRMSVLRHALLSYLFGVLILGASVNLVVSLAS